MSPRVLSALAALALLAGCEEIPVAQVVVRFHLGDIPPGLSIEGLELRVLRRNATDSEWELVPEGQEDLTRERISFPVSVPLVPADVDEGERPQDQRFRVEGIYSSTRATADRFEAAVEGRFTPGARQYIDVYFCAASARDNDDGDDVRRNGCNAAGDYRDNAEAPSDEVLPWPPPETDGGAMDAGTPDGNFDAGFDAGTDELEIVGLEPSTDGSEVRAILRAGMPLTEARTYVLSTTDERLLELEDHLVTLTPEDDEVELVFSGGPNSALATGDQRVGLLYAPLTGEDGAARESPRQLRNTIRYRDSESVLTLDDDAALAPLAVSAGQVCAIQRDAVVCWGDGGDGRAGEESVREVSVAGALELAAGRAHVCARDAGGAVRCWGEGSAGQLGDGTATRSSTPVEVALPEGVSVRALALGDDFSCALGTSDVWCWGDNAEAQLGPASPATQPSPVALPLEEGFEPNLIAAGRDSVCVAGVGGVRCHGADDVGQTAPGAVGTREDIEELVSGPAHYCVRVSGGQVYCWGDALGTAGATPAEAIGYEEEDVVATGLVAGDTFTCAARAGLQPLCWGEARGVEGERGLIGAARATDRLRGRTRSGENRPADPTQLPVRLEIWPSGGRFLSAGGGLLCGADIDDQVFCLGPPQSPLLRDGWRARDHTDDEVAPAFRMLEGLSRTIAPVVQPLYSSGELRGGTDNLTLDSGPTHTCVDGFGLVRPRCWGGPAEGYRGWHGTDFELPMTMPTSIARVDSSEGDRGSESATLSVIPAILGVGPSKSCYLRIDSGDIEATCTGVSAAHGVFWAMDWSRFPAYDQPISLEAGEDRRCLYDRAIEEIVCDIAIYPAGEWPAERTIPVAPDELAYLTLGWEHGCALTTAGALWCWGRESEGQLGTALDDAGPRVVASDVRVAVAGGHTTCFVQDDGLRCLGAGAGEVAEPDIVDVELSPHEAGDVGCFVSNADVAGSPRGSLRCWGIFGGTFADPAEVKAWTSEGDRVFDISVAAEHVCWVGYGHVRCRGNDTDGRLGSYDLYGPRYIHTGDY